MKWKTRLSVNFAKYLIISREPSPWIDSFATLQTISSVTVFPFVTLTCCSLRYLLIEGHISDYIHYRNTHKGSEWRNSIPCTNISSLYLACFYYHDHIVPIWRQCISIPFMYHVLLVYLISIYITDISMNHEYSAN